MPNASEMVAALKGLADTLHAKCNHVDTEDVILVKQAAELIRRLTNRMTLDECCEVLNENEYNFEYWDDPWEVEGDHLYNGMDALTHFEAKALARAYEAQKEDGVG